MSGGLSLRGYLGHLTFALHLNSGQWQTLVSSLVKILTISPLLTLQLNESVN